ncbi:MAG: UDP-N-acetylmuramoyl-L-alanyl-D-glutamate--2,6-diaminopimelate ligase [Hydrogenibacillus sp.]|nr:UDP-N-acetylmuramoyl-L-alanyl-D-glutamate--2,6-diaminopimelate ligase [Hydrogenibacillus sp.]
MRLETLIDPLRTARLYGDPTVEIEGIAIDSRAVRPGELFVALPGTVTDGHRFLSDAARAGARAAVVARGFGERAADLFSAAVEVAEPKRVLSLLLNVFYGSPGAELDVIGVTGTNGKTTTTSLIRQLLERHGVDTGLIGTVEIAYGDVVEAATATTPDPVTLFRTLARMRETGMRAVVMEVSSHALDQGRTAGLPFCQAVFTNLTQDHLDYHGTMDAYRAAKGRLFHLLGGDFGLRRKNGARARAAVLNANDPASDDFARETVQPIVRYAVLRDGESAADRFMSGVDLVATDVVLGVRKTAFVLRSAAGEAHPVHLPLIGRHNVENALAAAASAHAYGIALASIARSLNAVTSVPGRLERIDCGQPFGVFVDYAHTPDGLKSVLAALRPITAGRLIAVFGAGGNRDPRKRPLMGAAVAEGADLLWVTSDNPRDEDPERIIADVLAGIPQAARARTASLTDRREAIGRAIQAAEAGDVVLIAGKGHETGQIIRGVVHPFDDRLEARRALEKAGYRCS